MRREEPHISKVLELWPCKRELLNQQQPTTNFQPTIIVMWTFVIRYYQHILGIEIKKLFKLTWKNEDKQVCSLSCMHKCEGFVKLK